MPRLIWIAASLAGECRVMTKLGLGRAPVPRKKEDAGFVLAYYHSEMAHSGPGAKE